MFEVTGIATESSNASITSAVAFEIASVLLGSELIHSSSAVFSQTLGSTIPASSNWTCTQVSSAASITIKVICEPNTVLARYNRPDSKVMKAFYGDLESDRENYMKKLIVILSIAGAQCFAQSNADPLSAGAKMLYNITKNDVLKSAGEMPEADYSFKPVGTVRSFGELVGHVADGQYEFCSVVLGGKQPPSIEKSKTTKADLIQALQDAFTYCDGAYNGMTDAHAADLVPFGGHNMTKLTVLDFNSAHNYEHYGNMVTYLRIKNLVPPSSKH